MSDYMPLVGSIIGGLAGLAALIKVFIDARNAQPGLAETLENMATKMAGQIQDLRSRVAKLEDELRESNDYNKLLVRQLCDNRITPIERPKKVEANPG